jgi:hypothetical protein
VHATIPEELLLLAYDEVTGRSKPGGSIELDCGIAGAVLHELRLAGRIDVVGGLVTVLDPTPVAEPECDAVLGRVAAAEKGRKPDWWVSRLRFGMRNRLLARLVDGGVLRMERRDVLWLFSARRYFAVDTGIRSAARARLERVVVHGGEPDARTAALASLLSATGLARRTFPEQDRKQLKTRMGRLGEGDWVSAAVRKAIRSIQSSD